MLATNFHFRLNVPVQQITFPALFFLVLILFGRALNLRESSTILTQPINDLNVKPPYILLIDALLQRYDDRGGPGVLHPDPRVVPLRSPEDEDALGVALPAVDLLAAHGEDALADPHQARVDDAWDCDISQSRARILLGIAIYAYSAK